jgi:HD superfamily phosphohydrolase
MSRITPNDHNNLEQQQSSSDASASSTASSVRRFRLLREEEDEEPSAKRFKTTGEEKHERLRQLKYGDKAQTNDEIHQSIELCPVMKTLVDTTVFQRLRSIHQLGTSQYVYMCGDHNRFQHSLGVAHLAERLCKNIQSEQPKLGVTDKDVLCVKLAGLLHDIGHGPFSHLYETFRHDRLPKYLEANPDLREEYKDVEHLQLPDDWAHEDSSLIMVDAALAELGLTIDMNNLDLPLRQISWGPHSIDATSLKVFKPPNCKDSILTSRDFVFIKECIYGKPLPGNNGKFIGRLKKEQEWLYDIVNNRHNGLDVDKIDYYARDRSRTIGSTQIDIKMIEDARVAKGLCSRPEKCPSCTSTRREKHFMLCYPNKRVEATMDFFKTRLRLHSTVYQHHKTCSVGCMIMDMLCAADPFLRLRGTNGEYFPISRAANRSEFLLRLKDDVLALIEHSDDERLLEAQLIYRRIREHNMYKCAVDKTLNIETRATSAHCHSDEEDEQIEKVLHNMNEEEIKAGILNTKDRFNQDNNVELEAEDFVVEKFAMHHGANDKNPLDRMRYFDNVKNERLVGPADNLPEALPPNLADGEYNSIIPRSFQKVGIRIYVRDESKKGVVNQYFTQWFEGMKQGDVLDSPNTPDGEEAAEGHGDFDDDHHGRYSRPVALSQESCDGDDDYDDIDYSDPRNFDDRSPIPVKSKTR